MGGAALDGSRAKLRLLLVLLSYCVIAFAVHDNGLDLTRKLMGGGDGYTAGLPSKLFSTTLSAWNPYVQLGEYTFANTQYQPFYLPGLIPLTLFPNTLGYNIYILAHYAMAGFFFYCFVRNLGLGEYASYFGGVCFLGSGFMLAHKGHQAMLCAAVWLPLILLLVDRYSRSSRAFHAGLAGLALAMSILSGFPQITLYSAIVVFFYLGLRCFRLFEFPVARRVRLFALGGFTLFGFGIVLSSLQLFAVADTLPFVSRQKITLEMFNQDFLPVRYLGLFFSPSMLGCFYAPCFSAVTSTVEVYPYAGLLPLLLALFAFRRRGNSADVVFWGFVVLGAGILSLGLGPVQRILYHVPVYNLFRAPARHLFEISFGISVLAAFGLDELLASPGSVNRSRRSIGWSVAIVGLAVFGIAGGLQVLRYVMLHQNRPEFAQYAQSLLVDMYPYRDKPGMVAESLEIWRPTILYSLLCFAISWLVMGKLARRGTPAVWMTAAVSIVLLDVWLPYHRLYDNPDTSTLGKAEGAPELAYIESQKFDPLRYRLYPVRGEQRHNYPLLNMMYGLSVINDYGPMWLRRYQMVADFTSNGDSITAMFSPELMDALSVKYLIVNHGLLAHYARWVSKPSLGLQSPVLLPNFTCAAMACMSAQFPSPSAIVLGAPTASDVSLVQIPVTFEPETGYQLSFEGKSEGDSPGMVHIDLYSASGKWSGLGAGDMQSFVKLGSQFTKNVVALNSGRAQGKDGFLRIITTSTSRIEIRNLTLVKTPPGPKAYKEVFGAPEGSVVFENPTALPRFRFATELIPVAGLPEAHAVTLSAIFEPATQVTVEGLPTAVTVQPGKILAEKIENDSMSWTVETGNRGFFVVADSWFPGWIARVDGREVDIHIVNGFLRGIFVDGTGQHRIEMDFHPRSLLYGSVVTIAGLAVLAGTWLLSAWRTSRERMRL